MYHGYLIVKTDGGCNGKELGHSRRAIYFSAPPGQIDPGGFLTPSRISEISRLFYEKEYLGPLGVGTVVVVSVVHRV